MTTEETVAGLIESPAFRKAVATLAAEHDRTVEDIITLTEIPAPPFGEEKRAAAYLEMLRAHGLEDVEQDEIGNVMGLRRGAGNGSLMVVAAHLDTVFPAGTDVKVRREGTKLFAPGVGDDTRSLAVLLAYMRAMDAAGIRTRSDILFVGDVGEEGLGDLRGMRHLFTQGKYKGKIDAFFSIDGTTMDRMTVTGVGSKRYRVAFKGPGGHSYGAFGRVSPSFAMAKAIALLGEVEVPKQPKTTYSVSVLGGGTSVNAIPNDVWMEVDLRSEAPAELEKLHARFLEILEEATQAENAARDVDAGLISYTLTTIGDRPAGNTSLESELVTLSRAAIKAHGYEARPAASSTDANIGMSLGIPAIQIGSGGSGGREHSLEEWIDVEPTASIRGMSAGLAAVLAVAGVVD
ncbi:M20/M25/M40 family metallo-hydrolase [Acetobacteraceae bacterium H6797]|nr:M20/M25/M40 family metallo-hydrolase [Acetobacteraceae bacterium H6797]